MTLHTLPLDGDGQTSPLVRTQGNEARARISPDGRWIAYDLAQTGRREVFVQPFPDVDGARSKVSTDGGSNPIWSPSGGELFYAVPDSGGDGLWAVPFETAPECIPGDPVMLFEGPYDLESGSAGWYDVAPAGDRS